MSLLADMTLWEIVFWILFVYFIVSSLAFWYHINHYEHKLAKINVKELIKLSVPKGRRG